MAKIRARTRKSAGTNEWHAELGNWFDRDSLGWSFWRAFRVVYPLFEGRGHSKIQGVILVRRSSTASGCCPSRERGYGGINTVRLPFVTFDLLFYTQ
jgi:hypothetical protein